MGNAPSQFYSHDCPFLETYHTTLFTPVFGVPHHVNSFIISSSVTYTDPFYTGFILTPLFEQVAKKLTNQEFLLHFGAITSPSTHPASRLDSGKYYQTQSPNHLAMRPLSRSSTAPSPRPIINGDIDATRLNWRPERVDIDWDVVFPSIGDAVHGPPNGQNDPNQGSNQHLDLAFCSSTEIISPSVTHQQHLSTPPSHVPFLKIGLPLGDFMPTTYATQTAFISRLALMTSLHEGHNDFKSVLPFRYMGSGHKYGEFYYNFDKRNVYTDRDGNSDPQNRTEYAIYYNNGYKYPRPSLVSVRPLDGYAFDAVAYLPHLSTVPAHHLATIIILDVTCYTSLVVLNNFISQTLSYLQRGCIIPLVNVPVHIMLFNAEKADQRVIQDGDIITQLTNIGFSSCNIHLSPNTILPTYSPTVKPDNKKGNSNRRNEEVIYEALPLLWKDDLLNFCRPLWQLVYAKIFKLHAQGHWDRLASQSTKNENMYMVPGSVFPLMQPQGSFASTNQGMVLFAQKNIREMLKYISYRVGDQDDESILLKFGIMTYFRRYEIKALEYFKALEIAHGESGDQSSQNGSKDQNDGNPNLLPPHPSSILKSPYEITFGRKQPQFGNPLTHLPHLHSNHFIMNPRPLPMTPFFSDIPANRGFTAPPHYQTPFPPLLEKKTTEMTNYLDNRVIFLNTIRPEISNPDGFAVDLNQPIPPTLENVAQSDDSIQMFGDLGLVEQLKTLGLPTKYEFESFLIWTTIPIISDSSQIFTGYFYEPHVQYLVMEAVKKVWGQGDVSHMEHSSTRELNAKSNTKSITKSTTTLTTSGRIANNTILTTLLPRLSPPYRANPIEPLDYINWSLPNSIPNTFSSNNQITTEQLQLIRPIFINFLKSCIQNILPQYLGNLYASNSGMGAFRYQVLIGARAA